MSHFTTLISIPNPGETEFLESYADSHIGDALDPFWEATEDPDYLVFNDKNDEARSEYDSERLDCIKMPDGAIVSRYNRRASGFTIKDGKVYQEHAGPLKHEKRTKKAKKMAALPAYPMRKLYPTFAAYAEEYCGYNYEEEYEAYGYFNNPKAFWDWYQIGGRWPFMFLVKEDCTYIIEGERSWATEGYDQPGPEGYKWVAGARKKDIEWDLMKTLATEPATKRFAELEERFRNGPTEEDHPLLAVTEEGIMSWGDLIYKKDETLEQYLERQALGPDCKYPTSTYGYIDDGEYYSHGDMGWWGISSNEKPEDQWRKMLQDFIGRLPEDEFLVSVDCHI